MYKKEAGTGEEVDQGKGFSVNKTTNTNYTKIHEYDVNCVRHGGFKI